MREMYIHKKCRPDEYDLDYDNVKFGYCGECGLQGTIYHVKGSDKLYTQKKFGVTTEHGENTTGETVEAIYSGSREIAETIPEDAGLVTEIEAKDIDSPRTEQDKEVAESIPNLEEGGYTSTEGDLDELAEARAKAELLAAAKAEEEDASKSVPYMPLSEKEALPDTAVEPGTIITGTGVEGKRDLEAERAVEEETIEALKAKLAALEGKKE